MSGLLFGDDTNQLPSTRLVLQTSLQAVGIPVVHGQNSLTPNLIDYEDFTIGSENDGSKGGGSKSGGDQYYQALTELGLCEGPIFDVISFTKNQGLHQPSYEFASGVTFHFFNGTPSQETWSGATEASPFNYSSLAYAACSALPYGTSPNLPQFTFEIRGAISCAVFETYVVAGDGNFTPTYFTLASSATDRVTIPGVAPYQVQALNFQAAGSWLKKFHAWDYAQLEANSGVIDDTGRVFTRVNGTPSAAGEFQINGGSGGSPSGKYNFFSADANIPVTIIDLVVSPGAYYATPLTATFAEGDTQIEVNSTTNLANGMPMMGPGLGPGSVIDTVDDATHVTLTSATISPQTSVALYAVGAPLLQDIQKTPPQGRFYVSVQAGSYGQYTFSTGDAGATILIVDIPDADPSQSITDLLTNSRYGAGLLPQFLGDLSVLQTWCYAAGLFISPVFDGTKDCLSFLGDLIKALSVDAVWSDGQLTFVPYGDQVLTGYGFTYTPNLTPVYNLTDDDYMSNKNGGGVGQAGYTGDDPVIIGIPDPISGYNDVKVTFRDRGNSYNPAVAEAFDQASIDDTWLRTSDLGTFDFLCYGSVALASAQLQLGRVIARPQYAVTLPWYFILLDPMDIITITDEAIGMNQRSCRISQIVEDQNDGSLHTTLEDLLPGTGSLGPLTGLQGSGGSAVNTAAPTAGVNQAIFIEPPAPASSIPGAGFQSTPQLQIAADGIDSLYGGCQVWVALAAGGPYAQVGSITGSMRLGLTTADLPAFLGSNPDTVDPLEIQLDPFANGTLQTGSDAQAANGQPIIYMSASGELLSFVDADLTAPGAYTLTRLYRALGGTCSEDDNPIGTPFAVLDGSQFSEYLPPSMIGTTLYFKLLGVNVYGAVSQTLADVSPLSYTVQGLAYSFTTSSWGTVIYGGGRVQLGTLADDPTDGVQMSPLGQCSYEGVQLSPIA